MMMNKKILIIFLLSLFGWNGFSQTMKTLNDFKYVVIPLQYKMSKEDNEFLLNSTTKYLLKQEGFTTYMEVEKFPKDLVFNQCLALYADLESVTTRYFSLNTKVVLKLKDCYGNVIFQTAEGESKKKNVEEAYKESLLKTFTSFSGVNYEYNGSLNQNIKQDKQQDVTGDFSDDKNNYEKPGTLASLVENSFSYEGTIFTLKKIEAGYLLLNANGDKEAFINETPTGNILYNSERLNGSLIISSNGDLEVEYFNTKSGKVEKAIFKKQP